MANPHRGAHHRGYLPHLDHAGAVQTVTFRLADSLPAAVMEKLASRELAEGEARAQREEGLNSGFGFCFLRDERVARLVADALCFYDEQRYRLIAWVIMPNHVHVVFEILPGWPLDRVVQNWKSFTAHRANRLLGRKGRFWYPDYYDRLIRDDAHLAAAVQYVHANPVQAGLVDSPEDWPFSSATWTSPRTR